MLPIPVTEGDAAGLSRVDQHPWQDPFDRTGMPPGNLVLVYPLCLPCPLHGLFKVTGIVRDNAARTSTRGHTSKVSTRSGKSTTNAVSTLRRYSITLSIEQASPRHHQLQCLYEYSDAGRTLTVSQTAPLHLTASSYPCPSGGQKGTRPPRLSSAELTASPQDERCGHAAQNWTI